MARIFKCLALVLIAALAAVVTTIVLHWTVAPSPAGANDIKYVDLISITLTALGLMITILGFFVAAAGVLGWTTLESKLKAHSIDYFKDQLKENAQLRREFEELIVKVANSGIENFKNHQGIVEGNEETQEPPSEQEYND